jgi:amidase
MTTPPKPAAPSTPPYRRPTQAELIAIGAREHLELTESEAAELEPSINNLLEALERLHDVSPLEPPPSPYTDRDAGDHPSPADDPFNAFVRLCDVRGSRTGILAGRTVGLKDNIDLADVPTTNASATAAFVPTHDAVVVERILAAGGRIVGKLNMDNFGAGASGESSAFGPPLNPHDTTRSAGGSSGGSGAAVASGAVDLALGVDQAGSARIPASFCGVVAIKATHGLVPTHGITHLDHTLDSMCPMAANVNDAALLLEAIAGDDWRDPQWVRGPIPRSWRRPDDDDVAGLRVGIVRESLDPDLCSPDVIANVQAVADVLRRAGCDIRDVSIPIWPHALPIAQTLICHLVGAMVKSECVGYGHLGYIDTERAHRFAATRRTESRLLPPYFKTWMLVESYLHEEYLNTAFGRLQNLRLRVRADIERTFEDVDLLLTPTTPDTAPPLLPPETAAQGSADRILRSLPYNTAPLNLSGHPVLAMPSGHDRNGMPTSVQLVAAAFGETLTIRAGRLVESTRPSESSVARN